MVHSLAHRKEMSEFRLSTKRDFYTDWVTQYLPLSGANRQGEVSARAGSNRF